MLFKAALINIFILAVDETTMSKVKGVVCYYELTENHHLTAVPISSTELFSLFQQIVLAVQPVNCAATTGCCFHTSINLL